MTEVRKRTFEAVLHHDSSLSDHLEYHIPSNMYIKVAVTFLSFTLPDDAVYSDPTAYLFISGNVEQVSLCVNQAKRKMGGFLIPICEPGNGNKICFAPSGLLLNEGELTFSILDKNLNEVTTSRIVVTMNIADANAK